MKYRVKFYLPNKLLQKQHPIAGRQEFEGECECVSLPLFQDAVGSLGGNVYEVDVRDLPDNGTTPKDNQIKRMWDQVEKALEVAADEANVYDDEINDVTDALETLNELREIYF